MSIAGLIRRLVVNRPLTAADHDANLTAIETAVDSKATAGLATASGLTFSATQRIFLRNSAGAGAGQEGTLTQLLDWAGSTQGTILYRGASGWVALAPGTAGQFFRTGGAAADPSWATVSGSGDALVANPLSQFAATTSAQLRGVISDKSGTGLLFFQSGDLGTPSAGTLTNCTGLPFTTGITGKPTTLSGYGITDAVGSGDGRLSDSRTPTAHSQAFSTITGLPTTLAGYGITDAIGSTDSRLSDSREWSATTVAQATAEAGISTTRVAYNPLRVFQSIAAYISANFSATGQALATAANAAAARTTIGAGTSSLAISSTAPAALAATAAAGSSTDAARADHTHQRDIDVIVIPVGDESTALTSGTNKVRFRMPFAATLLAVRSNVNTAPTGSTLIVDVNEAGTSVLGTKLSIDASETSSTTAASAATITDTSLADDAEISIDIDQIGSTVAGAGLKISLFVRRA